MEVEGPPKASRAVLLSLGIGMILLVALVASVLVLRLQPGIGSTCTGSCTVIAGTVVTMPSGVGENSQLNFSPDKITVVIGVNNTVTFQNLDSANHTVTSLTNIFNSGIIEPGKTWNYTFTTAGNYTYHCLIHPWMQGEVVVKQNAPGNMPSTVTIPLGTYDTQRYNFEPSSFVVFVGVNNTVKFVNEDSQPHTVTFAGLNLTSGEIAPGGAWVYTFSTAGTYTFYGDESWMVGSITILAT